MRKPLIFLVILTMFIKLIIRRKMIREEELAVELDGCGGVR